MSRSFAENLAGLPAVDHIAALELRDDSGQMLAKIENKSGSAGSVRVYSYLTTKWGSISQQAAKDGLEMYAEHTDDARANPGRHPNIDRLLDVANNGSVYQVKIIET
jgi:hypothetical protein